MKLPSYKRINENNFDKDYVSLIRTLASSLNIGIENIYLALDNRLTFQDNFSSTIKQIDITVNSNGIPTGNSLFQLNRYGGTNTQSDTRIIGVTVLRAENLTNSTSYVTGAPFISWTQEQNGIRINHITGLIPGHLYRMTLLSI